MIAEVLRGAADILNAAARAYDEQRTGFSEREAGDWLDAAGITDAGLPDEFIDLDELDLPRSTEPQCGHPSVACAAECRRVHTAEGVSADTPDTAPSPGHPADLSDSELLIRAAIAVDHAANAATTVVWTTELLNLADELRDRAAQFAAIEATDTP